MYHTCNSQNFELEIFCITILSSISDMHVHVFTVTSKLNFRHFVLHVSKNFHIKTFMNYGTCTCTYPNISHIRAPLSNKHVNTTVTMVSMSGLTGLNQTLASSSSPPKATPLVTRGNPYWACSVSRNSSVLLWWLFTGEWGYCSHTTLTMPG